MPTANKRPLILGLTMAAVIMMAAIYMVYDAGAEKTVSKYGDIDGSQGPEHYILSQGRLAVEIGHKVIWRSPVQWKVTSFELADATNDGTKDLLMVVWKHGSFGPYRPFWFKGEDREWSNHLFVYNLINDKVKATWCSSALDRPIEHLTVKDINRDSRNELLVSEKLPWWKSLPGQNNDDISIWQWKFFGFYRLD